MTINILRKRICSEITSSYRFEHKGSGSTECLVHSPINDFSPFASHLILMTYSRVFHEGINQKVKPRVSTNRIGMFPFLNAMLLRTRTPYTNIRNKIKQCFRNLLHNMLLKSPKYPYFPPTAIQLYQSIPAHYFRKKKHYGMKRRTNSDRIITTH